jgi:hypothetical protein
MHWNGSIVRFSEKEITKLPAYLGLIIPSFSSYPSTVSLSLLLLLSYCLPIITHHMIIYQSSHITWLSTNHHTSHDYLPIITHHMIIYHNLYHRRYLKWEDQSSKDEWYQYRWAALMRWDHTWAISHQPLYQSIALTFLCCTMLCDAMLYNYNAKQYYAVQILYTAHRLRYVGSQLHGTNGNTALSMIRSILIPIVLLFMSRWWWWWWWWWQWWWW